jgi:hypothetical protein
MTAPLRDISRGGAAVNGEWRLAAGQEIELELPAGGAVSARVVRCVGGSLSMVFRLDGGTASGVDRAIEALGHRRVAA